MCVCVCVSVCVCVCVSYTHLQAQRGDDALSRTPSRRSSPLGFFFQKKTKRLERLVLKLRFVHSLV